MTIALRLVPTAALELVTLLLIRLFFVHVYVQGGGDVPASGLDGALGYSAATVGLVLLMFLVVRLLVGYATSRSVYRVVLGAQHHLTTKLFGNYLGQHYQAQRDSSQSEQRQTLFIAATALVNQMLLPIVQLYTDATIALAMLAVLVIKEPLATAALVAWFGLCFAAQSAATLRQSRMVGKARWDALNRMRMIADMALGDPRLTKLSASEAEFTHHFQDQARRHSRALAEEIALSQIPVFARELVLVSGVGLLILVLTLQKQAALVQVGAIAMFAAASVRLLPSFQRSVTFVQKLHGYAADLDKIQADCMIETELLDTVEAGTPLMREGLRLRRVDFRYPLASELLLDKADLVVARGERLLITGPSGAGKSTLILLICGLLRAEAGVVEIDGSSLNILGRVRQGRVALVPQDPFVANLSIIENIALPAPPEIVDRERAATLLRKLRLDLSLDDKAGENGSRLSGGERQRLAVLRAIQRRPELLILDEATSQLDAETEAVVYRCLLEECAGATVLAIAHRAPPPGLFDRHVVLDKGRITMLKDGVERVSA